MNNKHFARDIYYLNEDSIYIMIENFEKEQMIDKTLVYCFVKAFYINVVKLYINNKKTNFEFEELYNAYKENLKIYYKTNNPQIEDIILDQILNFFDNSFGLINTIENNNIEDSYEFRHYTIKVFELLRMILENKSKAFIRENIFDNYIRIIIQEAEKITMYIDAQK